jgi:hypothetical protein
MRVTAYWLRLAEVITALGQVRDKIFILYAEEDSRARFN